MAKGSFDASSKQIGGYMKNGRWFIGDGHHRVAAAIKYGMNNNGDYSILNGLLRNGEFSTPSFQPPKIIFPHIWQ